MGTINDDAMLEASDLSAKQLEEAINLVEAEYGANPDGRHDGMVAAVLGYARAHLRHALAAAGR